MAPRRKYEVKPGDRFGFGTVLEEFRICDNHGRTVRGVRLLCDCGRVYEARLHNVVAKTRPTVSCGCYHQYVIETKEPTVIIKHGFANHEHYQRWSGMMQRCYNVNAPNYFRYGERGIRVCKEWHDVQTFIEYLEDNLGPIPYGWTLDRIDNDGDYEPGNIRWASKSLQRRNQRRYIARHGSEAPSKISREYRQNKPVKRRLVRPTPKKHLIIKERVRPQTKRLLVKKTAA